MRISLPKKTSLVILLVFLFLTVATATLALKVRAQVPPPRVPCDPRAVGDPEFNSLRPYQASPCGSDEIQALFCGNKAVIQVTKDETITIPAGDSCEPQLDVHWQVGDPSNGQDYWIDMSETEFPIAGNTEQVANSQSGGDTFDDAQKVNEYASWYLSGVNSKAEYGDAKNTPTELINYSGPIQKLFPSSLLDFQRINSLLLSNNNTNTQSTFEEGEEIEGTAANHNQIVVCATKGTFGLGKSTIVPCYDGNGSPAKAKSYRLQEWVDGSLSPFNTFFNFLGTDQWNNKYPPLPWQFTEEIYYRKAYNEWRGKSCAILPLLGLQCLDIPGVVPNEWAELFQYIPLSTTADKNKKMMISTVTIQGASNTHVVDKKWGLLENGEPVLYFPHTQETASLSAFLNSSYIPRICEDGTSGTSCKPLDGSIDPLTTESNALGLFGLGGCKTANIRSNEGDDLFPIHQPGDIGVEIYFLVDRIDLSGEKPDHDAQGNPITRCMYSGLVTIEIPHTPVKLPQGESIWKSAVAGPTSTFRKIFPKVEKGSPISCIADIPSETKAKYKLVEGVGELTGVESLQNPAQKFDPEDARIYFPHWGSIYDYFLKGIQTALRPKGYGEPLTDGNLCTTLECGELPELPAASGSCATGSVSPKVGDIPQSLKDIVSAAAETYKVPPNLILGVMYGEGAFNTPPYQKYEWTDENVKNWASCVPLPNCSGPESSVVPFLTSWDKLAEDILPDLQEINPARTTVEPCILLDAIYALAKDLHDHAGGGVDLANKTCYGITMSSSSPGSCTWDDHQTETAIRGWEFGAYYDPPDCPTPGACTCATLAGSCASGGGFAAGCTGDTCEQVGGSDNTSHNACVWDVAHGN